MTSTTLENTNGDTVQPLGLEVKTNGHNYKLYMVQDNVYIYRQLDKSDGSTVGFEAFISQTRPAETIQSKDYPQRHVYPTERDWGHRAWTLRASSTKEELLDKFKEMLKIAELRDKSKIEKDVNV